jgi:hypothetical protein
MHGAIIMQADMHAWEESSNLGFLVGSKRHMHMCAARLFFWQSKVLYLFDDE